jgi:hypothetical protein
MNEHKKRLQENYKNRRVTGGIYALRNTVTGTRHVELATDLNGAENRFRFAQMTDTPVSLKLSEEWKRYGADSFVFEPLEELTRGELQSDREFRADLEELLKLRTDENPGQSERPSTI